jgi:hypothetical protein
MGAIGRSSFVSAAVTVNRKSHPLWDYIFSRCPISIGRIEKIWAARDNLSPNTTATTSDYHLEGAAPTISGSFR